MLCYTSLLMKRVFFLASFISLLPLFAHALVNDYVPESVGAGKPEVHIKQDGTMTIRAGKVDQVVGTTFFLQLRWGQLPMRFTMKTDEKTEVRKRYGGQAGAAQIKIGDYLDAEGEFFVGSDFFGLTARSVKDWSLQEESETFSGTIIEVNQDGTFLLRNPLGKTVTVRAATSTVIRKGPVSIQWSRLAKNDTVLLADGAYDYSKNTLTAGQIVIFRHKTAFAARNYEGTLMRIEAPRLPTSLIVSVGGADYTVRLSEKTAVLKKDRSLAQLARFVAGDTVRFYGPLREEENILSDALIVDAEIVRNLNL